MTILSVSFRRVLFYIIVLPLLSSSALQAHQYMQVEIPLAQRLDMASDIVEGEVVFSQSFWDADHQMIYTAHSVLPIRSFKGETRSAFTYITKGGVVGLDAISVSTAEPVVVGVRALFLMRPSDINAESSAQIRGQLHEGIVPMQSLLQRNPLTGAYSDMDEHYKDIEALRAVILPLTSQPERMIASGRDEVTIGSRNSGAGVSLLSPTTITAGTLSPLTISGGGFGTAQGFVFFSNADAGGQNFTPAQAAEVSSWSDTEIVVLVPSRAGTGIVVVQTSGGVNFPSGQSITVPYAESTVISNATGPSLVYQVRHADTDGNGGYIWTANSDFASEPDALPSFERALETWGCTSGMTWEVAAATTTVDVIADDGVNIVRFDTGSELNPGVLGVCTSYYSGCFTASGIDWYVVELDIVFDAETDWNFGEGPSGPAESDFESVALHELGHGHQLAHVIDQGDVMNFQLFTGTDIRDPSMGNDQASQNVHTRSTNGSVCNVGPLSTFDCSSGSCAGDINGDNVVDVADFLLFNSDFGTSCSCPADLNGSGTVDVADFLLFNSAFGQSCQ